MGDVFEHGWVGQIQKTGANNLMRYVSIKFTSDANLRIKYLKFRKFLVDTAHRCSSGRGRVDVLMSTVGTYLPTVPRIFSGYRSLTGQHPARGEQASTCGAKTLDRIIYGIYRIYDAQKAPSSCTRMHQSSQIS